MTNYCLALPYLSGGLEPRRRFGLEGRRQSEEHNEFYKIAGVTRENIWIQRDPPVSGAPDLEIVSLETDDPAKMLKEFATSNHPWAVRFREYTNKDSSSTFHDRLLHSMNR